MNVRDESSEERGAIRSIHEAAFERPDEADLAFMALELEPGALDGVRGTVRYPDAFGL